MFSGICRRFRRGKTDDFWQKLGISGSSSANPRSAQGIFDSSSEISTMTSWKTRYTPCGALRLCLLYQTLYIYIDHHEPQLHIVILV